VEQPETAPSFDPADHPIGEVQAYVLSNPEERGRVLDAERSGKARVTLISWLENE
jgi:hypothetical protein